jgi:predicted HicB family RNase H-like nuclease
MESKKKLFDKIKSEPAKLPIKTVEPAPLVRAENEERTPVQIRKSLHQLLKIEAVKTGVSLKDLVEDILTSYLTSKS